MRRLLPLLAAALLLPACGLFEVPPPPVPLSALDGRLPAVDGGGPDAALRRAEVKLLDAAPEGALLSLHFPDVAALVEKFRNSHMGALLASPDMLGLFGSMRGAGVNLPTGGGIPVDPAALLSSLRGEAFLSLEDLEFPRESKAPSVRIVAGVHLGARAEQVEGALDGLLALAASQRGVTVEKGTAADTPFARVVVAGAVEMAVEVAVCGDALLVGVGRESATAAIERLAAGHGSLSESESFREAMKRCGNAADSARIFVDANRLYRKIEPLLPEEARRAIEALGIPQIRALAATVRFEGREAVVSTLVDSPGGKDVFSRLLSAHAVDRRFLDLVPEDATGLTLFPFDAPEILAALRSALPETARASLESDLATLRDAGWNLERDVFEVFGPRCAVVNLPVAGERAPGIEAVWDRFLSTALVFEAPDMERARKSLLRLPRGDATTERRDIVVGATDGVCYRFAGSRFPPGFAVGCGLREGFLVVAFSEDCLRRMLQGPSAGGANRFLEALRDAPAGAVTLSYEEAGDGLDLGLGLLARGARGSRPGGAPAPRDEGEPSAGDLAREFPPSVGWTVADGNGILSVQRTSTGGIGSTSGLTGLATLAAVTLPGLSKARLESNEAAAIAAIHAIRKAEEEYRRSAIRDSDGDGEGEFAFLAELLGERRGVDSVPPVRPSPLSGYQKHESGAHERAGYLFRVYLPAEDGSPIGGHERPARLARVDGDLAEAIYVVVAWPLRGGKTGARAFAMDASGVLYACADGGYEGTKAPPPDVLSSQPQNLAANPRADGEPARDRKDWRRVR